MKLIKLIVEKNNKSAKGRLGVLSGFKNLDINAQHYEAIGKAQLLKEVQELEAEGLIKAKWYDGKSELISIRYSMEILPLLYERLGTKHPKFELAEYQRRVQTGYERLRKEWLKKYYDKMLSQLADGTIPHELREEKLLLCMEALDQLEEPIYKKVFSKHYLNDSKVFEKSLEKSVISAAKEHYKEVIDDNMSKSQILSQLFIEEYSQTLYIKGELMIYIAGELIDLAKHIYGIMLNSQTLKHAEIASAQRIKKIVTIENQANFEYQQFEKGVLYIYTHGYFSQRKKFF